MQDQKGRNLSVAGASNEDLERLFSALSHELHTPLRHINNFTELLSEHLRDSLDQQGGHYLDIISNAATDIDGLIDQLLEWARVGNAPMNFTRVDLNALVNNVIHSFEPEIADRQVEWDIENLPVLVGDINMLGTAWRCLVSNALKFTRLQPVAKIRIAVEPSQANNNDIVMSIKDNGVGFDPQHQDKVFDVLQTMHNNQAFEGHGIGLATVKRIVQRHGGQVWADSEPGKGTAIYLTLGNVGQKS